METLIPSAKQKRKQEAMLIFSRGIVITLCFNVLVIGIAVTSYAYFAAVSNVQIIRQMAYDSCMMFLPAVVLLQFNSLLIVYLQCQGEVVGPGIANIFALLYGIILFSYTFTMHGTGFGGIASSVSACIIVRFFVTLYFFLQTNFQQQVSVSDFINPEVFTWEPMKRQLLLGLSGSVSRLMDMLIYELFIPIASIVDNSVAGAATVLVNVDLVCRDGLCNLYL